MITNKHLDSLVKISKNIEAFGTEIFEADNYIVFEIPEEGELAHLQTMSKEEFLERTKLLAYSDDPEQEAILEVLRSNEGMKLSEYFDPDEDDDKETLGRHLKIINDLANESRKEYLQNMAAKNYFDKALIDYIANGHLYHMTFANIIDLCRTNDLEHKLVSEKEISSLREKIFLFEPSEKNEDGFPEAYPILKTGEAVLYQLVEDPDYFVIPRIKARIMILVDEGISPLHFDDSGYFDEGRFKHFVLGIPLEQYSKTKEEYEQIILAQLKSRGKFS